MPMGTDVVSAALASPFVSSWIGRARPGDLMDPAPERRAAAWAQWGAEALIQMAGAGGRPYVALRLPGAFYSKNSRLPTIDPHLEVSSHVLERPDPTFPDRIAQAGNALLCGTWLLPEVQAVKRSLLAPVGDAGQLLELLAGRGDGIRHALATVTGEAAAVWSDVEASLVSEPGVLSEVVTAPFSTEEIAEFWAPAAEVSLTGEFDAKLLASEGDWVSRRVGVWSLMTPGESPGRVPVVVPRLTRNSMTQDPLFAPASEAGGAALVRALLLRRLLQRFATPSPSVVAHRPSVVGATGLRAVPARVGEKLPEANLGAAVKFVHAWPDPVSAWELVSGWAAKRDADGTPRAALTVTEQAFRSAHREVSRSVARAEEPTREDVNTLLPLAWDSSARVVRLTFSPRV